MTRSIPILLSKTTITGTGVATVTTTNTSQVLNIAQSINLQGFKVGVTVYFKAEDESFYSYY